MAILSVIEQWSARSAEGDFERLGLIRQWEVMTDSTSDTEDTVSTATDPSSGVAIPAKGTSHDVYSYATVQNIQVERAGSPYRWMVTCIYGGGTSNYEAQKYIADVEWDVDEVNEDIDYDVYGQTIANSANERFEGVKAIWFDQVLRITRTETTFDYAQARSFMRTRNAVEFLGAPAGSAFMGPIRARRIWELSGYIWRTTYNIWFREINTSWNDGQTVRGPWDLRLLNEGYRVKSGVNDDGSTKYTELTENGVDDGERVSKPVLLNAAGTAPLANGAAPLFRYFTIYPVANWTPLGLEYS